ncbi:MAG: hypothetical protein ACR2G4_11655 [Pyrinomonadaceae bacterium]
MSSAGNQSGLKEHLDQVGREIIRVAASNEAEAEATAALLLSPFLYARLRTRIAVERERREAGESWLALLGVVWRAVPAMALVAVCALALWWTSGMGAQSPGGFGLEAFLDVRDAGIEHVMFAERRALSSDEVLATILQDDEREISR